MIDEGTELKSELNAVKLKKIIFTPVLVFQGRECQILYNLFFAKLPLGMEV